MSFWSRHKKRWHRNFIRFRLTEYRLLTALALLGSAALIDASEPLKPTQLQAEQQSVRAESPWRRIVLLGASATAGMIDPAATNFLCGLAPYLEAALLVPHDPVRSVASRLFFFGPQRSGQAQIAKALAHEPTLVIGIDFLFWYCYGDAPSEQERLRRLEEGLELLGRLKCPLVLGDIPDASAAANGMLRPAQIPEPRTITAVNERIKEWVAAREQTAMIEVEAFMRAARENKPLKIRNRHWPETKSLLQQDKLHPSARGAIVLTVAILDSVLSVQPTASEKDVRWDLKELAAQPRTPAVIPVKTGSRSNSSETIR